MTRLQINSGKIALAMAASLAAGSLCSRVMGQTPATWIGPAAGLWNVGGNWSGGVVPNGNFNVFIDAGAAQNSVVTLNINAGITNLGISPGDQLNIGNNLSLAMTGGGTGVSTFGNIGTLTLNPGANDSNFGAAAGVMLTVTGGGTIVLNAGVGGSAQLLGGGTFVNSNNTIRGAGNIATNNTAFDNKAVINADVNGAAIFIDPVAAANGFLNSGTMTASNGGTLRMHGQFGGGIINTGTISASNLSFVSLEGGISIAGGTYTTSGSGVVRVAASNGATLSGFANLGNLSTSNNSTLDVIGDVFNSGSINVVADVNASNLRFVGTTSLTGGGVINLSTTGGGNAALAGNGALTNVNNLIRGFGELSQNQLSFTNGANGIVDADTSAKALFIDPVAAGMTNNGVMRATNGGVLQFHGQFGGALTNTGTISAANGSEVQLFGGIGISGGTFSTTGTGVVRVADSQSASLDAFANIGNITTGNNATANITGNVLNTGSVNVVAGANNSALRFNGTTALGGAGTINLGSAGASNAVLAGNGTLINVNNRIRGYGELAQNQLSFVNAVAGVVDADTIGKALAVDPVASGMINNGVMRATNGGFLQITGQNGGGVTNNGTISATTGSEVQLFSGIGISGGTYTTAGTGVIRIAVSQTVSLDSFTSTGNITVGNNSTMNVTTDIVNVGSINLNADVNNSALRFNGVTNLTGAGTINLSNTGGSGGAVLAGSGGLTNVNNRIRGYGELAQNQLSFTNGLNGVVDADTNGKALFVDPAAAGMTNNGIMRATNGGLLQFNGQFGGGVTNTGTISAATGSEVQLFGGIGISGGTLASTGTGLVRVSPSQLASLDAFANIGTLLIDNNSTVNATNLVRNSGTIILSTGPNDSVLAASSGTTTLTGGGTVTLLTTGTFSGSARLAGAGSLENVNNLIQGFGALGNNSMFFINDAAGVVDANVNGRLLFVDPVAAGMINNGIMRATNGGVMQFHGQFGGGVTNNGTISAANASNVQLAGGIGISGGTFNTAGTGSISVPISTSASISDSRNTGNIQILNNSVLTLGGTVTNSGSISLNAAANDSVLSASGSVNLTGGGVVNLSTTAGGSARFGNSGGTFDTNNTIRGFGAVANNNTAIINRGLMTASGGDIFIDPVSATNGFVNLGTMRVENGASMGISGQFGGGVVGTGGLVNVQGGGTLNTFGGIGIAAGSIQLDGTWNHSSGGVSMTFVRGAGTLNLSGGAGASVNPNGGNTGTSRIARLTISGGASPDSTLDLNDNDLILTAGNLQTVESQIRFARHGALWDRPGLTSTAAKNSLPKNKNLGAISGAEFHSAQGAAATFDGFSVANTDVVIKYTYNGDADLNGVVDFDDYSRIDSGFNNLRTGWFNGDFDYSGGVDFDDYSLIDQAYNTQSGSLRRAMSYLDGGDRSNSGMNSPALRMVMDHYQQFGQPYATAFINSVPEPTAAGMVCGLAALATRRRRRQPQRGVIA